jgi:hypothetical protein
LTDSELPYLIHLQVTGVNINEIIGRAGAIFERAHGILQGSLQLAGCMKDPSLASGGGNLEVKTGYLEPYPILKELGAWTQIDELKRLDLEEALSKFSVVGQDIKVDSLKLTSKNCQVNLWGTVGREFRDSKGRPKPLPGFPGERVHITTSIRSFRSNHR